MFIERIALVGIGLVSPVMPNAPELIAEMMDPSEEASTSGSAYPDSG